jgi:hypothetical protein
MGNKEKKLSNEERLENLRNQLVECEILYHKLSGAIEVLESVIGEKNEKRD